MLQDTIYKIKTTNFSRKTDIEENLVACIYIGVKLEKHFMKFTEMKMLQ